VHLLRGRIDSGQAHFTRCILYDQTYLTDAGQETVANLGSSPQQTLGSHGKMCTRLQLKLCESCNKRSNYHTQHPGERASRFGKSVFFSKRKVAATCMHASNMHFRAVYKCTP
jgi:hypothetical protein